MSRAGRGLLALGMGLLMLGAAVPAMANHAQSAPSGGTVTFDHHSGNEWWVQVVVKATGTTVSKVEVMDDGGAWSAMTAKPEWGAGMYALSYHIEPGHRVTFRATTPGGLVTSCPFTHPAGAEQCSTTPPPPPPPGTFDATFNQVRGNAYWIQAQVLANTGYTISKVELTTNNLDWKPLAKQSWGTSMYAASYPLPEGTIVQLKATASSGNTDASACYRWVPASGQDATQVSCSQPPPTDFEWHTYHVGAIQGGIGEMSIGDADGDGRSELYATTTEGLFRYVGGSASTSPTRTLVAHHDGGALAVGDADNDGKPEVYTTSYDYGTGNGTVHRIAWTGSSWSDTVIFRGPAFTLLGPITVGDADNDGSRELYVASDDSGAATLIRLAKTSTGWSGQTIVDLGDDGKFLDIGAIWVGDGDRDGKREVAVTAQGYGYTSVFLIDKPSATAAWTHTRLGSHSGGTGGVVAGDVDGDGLGEVAATGADGDILHWRLVNGAWQETRVAVAAGEYPTDLFLGDADNDGRQELYMGTGAGSVYKVSQAPGTVAVQRLGTRSQEPQYGGPSIVLVGDGDGDARRELWTDLMNFGAEPDQTAIYRWEFEAPQTFTFSEEKGNEYWLEVRIRSNYDVYAVMATFNCDTSRDPADLSYRADIGKWVLGSTRIPAGTKVTFDAYGQWGSGESQGFIHPNGTQTSGC